jgi:hypothetical protein
MMQGDSYMLGIQILNNAGNPVTVDDVTDVEITIGHLVKSYRKLELLYDEGLHQWLFPLSQQETFGYWPSSVKAQVRVVWANGIIEGKPIYGIRIDESMSKEVL